MKDSTGKWIGYGVGDSGDPVKEAKRLIKAKFSYGKQLDDSTTLYTPDFQPILATYQGKKNVEFAKANKPLLRSDGVLDFATQDALGMITRTPTAPTISIVHFSIGGAGSTWDSGYQYDIGELLDKSKCFHQPIGYNTAPIPMNRGVTDGVNELIRQLDMPRGPKGENCTVLPWCATAYSMGAIVFMKVLMRVLYGDLARFKATYKGSSAFGNPMRQHGHTFPGCPYTDGEGIVYPTAHDCPVEHWDLVADRSMEGSRGDDLYTNLNKAGTSKDQLADMRAIWDIVNTGNPLNLAKQVAGLTLSPTWGEGVGAVKAALAAIDFFILKGLSPHTTYQFIHPIPGDPRDCWQIALQHAQEIVASVPVRG